jgi:Fe-S-cluster containining protein
MTEETPWYRDGLRFKCTQCGNCCTGEPGYVWVNKAEIEAIAKRLELTVAQVEKQYVKPVGIRKTLKEYSNGDCVFFDSEGRGCTIYEDRPRQCRTWPFWNSTIKNEEAWKETCEECPGAGKGDFFPLEEIEIRRKVINI